MGAKFAGHYYSRTEWGFRDQMSTYYFAPSILWRTFSLKSDVFYYGFSLGYVQYKEQWSFEGSSSSISKGGVGATFDFGYDIRLKGNNFIGFKLTYTGGTIDLNMKDEAGNDILESLSAIDLSVGFRF